MPKSCCLLLSLLLISACGEPPPPPGPTAIEQRMDDRSASMQDWRNASIAEKQHFGRLYTETYLGQYNEQRSHDIIEYLDAAVSGMAENMTQAGMQREQLDGILAAQEIWLVCAAGARLMGWPSPLGDIRSASDRESEGVE